VWNDTASTLQLTTPPVIHMDDNAPAAPAAPAEKSAASPQHDMAL